MCPRKCLLLLGALALAARAVPSGLLAQWAGRSICEAQVQYDEDPGRVPRRIKVLRCAAAPDKMCAGRDGAPRSCCAQSSYGNTEFSCREIVDSVLVRYGGGEPVTRSVPVGCACVMQQRLTAEEV